MGVTASCLLAERRTVIRRLDASYPTIMALRSLVIEPQAALVECAFDVSGQGLSQVLKTKEGPRG